MTTLHQDIIQQNATCESESILGKRVSIDSELPGYFEIAREHLYTVLHRVEQPIARVLLVGPFASNRHHAYIPLVRWSRYLAARGIEVLRFDYRGVGESTGTFEQMTLSDWMEDVSQLHAWLKSQSPSAPIFLNGLGLGALLTAKLFEAGSGDGLILWSPPSDANVLLRSTLASWATLQKFGKRAEEQKSLAHYIQQFETAGSLEVNGYVWSAKLWHESFDLTLPACMTDAALASEACSRPVSITTLGKDASPLLKEGVPGYEEAKDFEWLFSATFHWIISSLAVC